MSACRIDCNYQKPSKDYTTRLLHYTYLKIKQCILSLYLFQGLKVVYGQCILLVETNILNYNN